MDEETVNDLRVIYGNSLPNDLFEQFIEALRRWNERQRDVIISTRGNRGDIVSSDGVLYFRVWHLRIRRRQRVVFAGAVEPSPRTGRPAIRFIGSNRFLRNVPATQRFPFRKHRVPPWICVTITPQSVQLFNNLADEQLQWFEREYDPSEY